MAICRLEWRRNKSKTDHNRWDMWDHVRTFPLPIYINTLDSFSGNSKVSMFADDPIIFNTKKNVSFTMQPEIDLISDWMTSDKLTISIDKCEVICFGSGNPPLKLKDTPIQYNLSCKYLSLHVDKWLQFNQHIKYLVKKNWTIFVDWFIEFDTCSHGIAYWCFITLTQNLWLIMGSLLMVQRLKPTWAKSKWHNED